MADEVARVYQWAYARLAALSGVQSNAPGGVWPGLADPGTPAPYVVFNWQGGSDVLGVAAFRLMVSGLLTVRVIGPVTDADAIVATFDAIDTSLNKASGAQDGVTIIACYREQVLPLPDELVNGVHYTTHAGAWRILAVPSGA